MLFSGFGLTNDFSMIRHTLPYLNVDSHHVSFVDLLPVWKQIELTSRISLPFDSEGIGKKRKKILLVNYLQCNYYRNSSRTKPQRSSAEMFRSVSGQIRSIFKLGKTTTARFTINLRCTGCLLSHRGLRCDEGVLWTCRYSFWWTVFEHCWPFEGFEEKRQEMLQ